ncbi:MAG TPA: non-ribosomal peptide synthetase, partial [Ktedonobacteraceae bacterium]|nr:non-ribosomal peptide synthetase [Ktedonobacteraceae bacterium]
MKTRRSTSYVHDWFSQVAAERPEKIAVRYGERTMGYGELERQSNRLARFLLSQGMQPGERVVLLSGDRLEVIVGLLASLKAALVAVPLDVRTPARRLQEIFAQTRPRGIWTQAPFQQQVHQGLAASGQQALVLWLWDSSQPEIPESDLSQAYAQFVQEDHPGLAQEPDAMCYLYFTSGSLGVPKGIAGRLKAIDHFIRWEQDLLGLDEQVRVSQLTTPSFDAFLRDVFVPLCAGGTLCIPAEEQVVLDGSALVRYVQQEQVQVVHSVPAVLRTLLRGEPQAWQVEQVRAWLVAGEPLWPGDVQLWQQVMGAQAQLVNLYGPTETTMTKFFYRVQPQDHLRQYIPVGKPMDGTQGLVLDPRGKICGPGKVGEVYIRTPYRSLGYYEQPQLTRQAFVPNPFSQQEGDLIYKTGDLGRWLADGNLELLGRKDQQVKIRGVRVELSEIEEGLREQEAVRDAVVVDHEDASGERYLCAYVVTAWSVSAETLQEGLRERLSEVMIPTVILTLPVLPRTLSGKVDRASLPVPSRELLSLGRSYVAARNPIEEMLVELWKQFLRLERVGVEDNFFTLGGHSLLATQVIARLRRLMGVEVPLRALFDTPTIAQLARLTQKLLLDKDQRKGQEFPTLVP